MIENFTEKTINSGKWRHWSRSRQGLPFLLFLAALIVSPSFLYASPVRVDAPAPADFSAVVEAVRPAVVSVQVTPKQSRSESGNHEDWFPDLPSDHPMRRFFERFGQEPFFGLPPDDDRGRKRRRSPRRTPSAQGSGFFISDDGYIVTNFHVIDDAESIKILLADGEEFEAELVGSDRRTDLALLKIDDSRKFTYVKFSESNPRIGEWVVAVGNPFGYSGTVTAGIVSASGRDLGAGPYDDFIQIDAPVNHGNSGGPTFNTKGEVIGVNTAIISPSGGNVGIAFAIPGDIAANVIGSLRGGGTVVRGWLGVEIQQVDDDLARSLGLEEDEGALVTVVMEDSPAEAAGLRPGDTILKVEDHDIDSTKELAKTIADYPPEYLVQLDIWRQGRLMQLDVKLGRLKDERPQLAQRPDRDIPKRSNEWVFDSLGMRLTQVSPDNQPASGALIAEVMPDGPIAQKGIRAGDIILEAGEETVSNPADFDRILMEHQARHGDDTELLLLRVKGRLSTRYVAIELPDDHS